MDVIAVMGGLLLLSLIAKWLLPFELKITRKSSDEIQDTESKAANKHQNESERGCPPQKDAKLSFYDSRGELHTDVGDSFGTRYYTNRNEYAVLVRETKNKEHKIIQICLQLDNVKYRCEYLQDELKTLLSSYDRHEDLPEKYERHGLGKMLKQADDHLKKMMYRKIIDIIVQLGKVKYSCESLDNKLKYLLSRHRSWREMRDMLREADEFLRTKRDCKIIGIIVRLDDVRNRCESLPREMKDLLSCNDWLENQNLSEKHERQELMELLRDATKSQKERQIIKISVTLDYIKGCCKSLQDRLEYLLSRHDWTRNHSLQSSGQYVANSGGKRQCCGK